MGKLVVKEVGNASDREKREIDDFILNENTNGEFINSLNYLAYHREGRFIDKSIWVADEGSGEIRGVFMAAENPGCPQKLISHPGTTFAGIIISRKISIRNVEEIINIMMEYYESKYKLISIRLRPEFFATQPFGEIPYFLMRRGYRHHMTGLSNVIDLSEVHDEKDILAMYDSAKRNQVRKVLRENQFIFHERNEIRRNVWENMNRTLGEKYHVHPTHTFEEICELMVRASASISAYYVDSISGEYGAFALIYRFKNVFHTQYLDTNYKYTGQYPNLLLIHKLIQIAKIDGYTKFSFGVSTEDYGKCLNYGLFNYKAGYGGGSIIQGEYEWSCG